MSLLAIALILAEAAPAAPPPQYGGRLQIFVSPAGEPFRVPTGQPYPSAIWFAQADTNHDGRLTEAEVIADFKRFAATLDTNKNGVIEGLEVQAYETDITPEVRSGALLFYGNESRYNSNGEKSAMEIGTANSAPMGAGKYGLLNIPEPVAAMDTDLTGRINQREVVEAASYRFGLIDTQEKGYITMETMPHSFAQDHSGVVRGKHRR